MYRSFSLPRPTLVAALLMVPTALYAQGTSLEPARAHDLREDRTIQRYPRNRKGGGVERVSVADSPYIGSTLIYERVQSYFSRRVLLSALIVPLHIADHQVEGA